MKYKIIVLACIVLVSCKTLLPTKPNNVVAIWIVPFKNQYYLPIYMGTIKHHSDVKKITIQNKDLYQKLNIFIVHIDTCSVDTPFLINKDPFAKMLIEFKSDNNDSLFQIGMTDIAMFGYEGKSYYPNDSLTKMIQPFIQEEFKKGIFPERKK